MAGLYRHRHTVDGAAKVNQGVLGVGTSQRKLVNFCSNDYLGLAGHLKSRQTMSDVALAEGVGSGASHLVSGHSRYHQALEAKLADVTGCERALLFSTGYMANMGLITALSGPSQHIIADKLNHASLVDACQLSCQQNGKKQFFRYRHNDLAHCEALLKKAPPHSLLVTDGVFSMDGDFAPLRELSQLAKTYNAILVVDDAHGFGCVSAAAGSVSAHQLCNEDVPVYMGTLGKAIGSYGAFVSGSHALIETLIQFARPYIYTTALPPAVAASSLANIDVMCSEPEHRECLSQNIRYFKQRLEDLRGGYACQLLPSDTAIQPLLIGCADAAMKISEHLHQSGFWVAAIRPPTVPQNTSRLRITLSAAHTTQQIDELLLALQAACKAILACTKVGGSKGTSFKDNSSKGSIC